MNRSSSLRVANILVIPSMVIIFFLRGNEAAFWIPVGLVVSGIALSVYATESKSELPGIKFVGVYLAAIMSFVFTLTVHENLFSAEDLTFASFWIAIFLALGLWMLSFTLKFWTEIKE